MWYRRKGIKISNVVYIWTMFSSIYFTEAVRNTTEARLYKDLFSDYNIDLRPLKEENRLKQIVVYVTFYINQIESLNEKDQKLTSHGYISLSWEDEFLTWNESDYGGIPVLVVPGHKVWLPEISPINSVLGVRELSNLADESRVQIFSNGVVRWIPTLKWVTVCPVDVTDFPYDTQECEIQYANWIYTVSLVNFSVQTDYESTEATVDSLVWTVVNTTMFTEQIISKDGTVVQFVKLKIRLKRNPTFFELNVLVPEMLLSFLIIPIFILPVESGEKISLGVTLMLSNSIFMLMMTDITPASGTIPKLTLVILICTIFSGLAVFMSVIIIKIHYHNPKKPVPQWIKRFILDMMGKLLCCMNSSEKQEIGPFPPNDRRISNHKNISDDHEKQKMEHAFGKEFNGGLKEIIKQIEYVKTENSVEDFINRNRDDWNLLARVIDRFLLCCYTLFVASVFAGVELLKNTNN